MFSNISRQLIRSNHVIRFCYNKNRNFCNVTNEVKNITSEISYLDIRVGRIVKISDHPTEENLYVQQIDVGDHLYEKLEIETVISNDDIKPKTRSIIAGIKEFCSVDELLNTDVVVVCNLKPRNIKGVPSNGMVLCCSNLDKTQVKPIRPPHGSIPGQVISFEGHNSLAFPPGANKLSFNRINKAYKAVCSDFIVNEDGIAIWKNQKEVTDIEFKTELGSIKGQYIDGTIS